MPRGHGLLIGNQAEILIHNFSHHYLKRQSWTSRETFIEHVLASGPEYRSGSYSQDTLSIHPYKLDCAIEWTWTNHKTRQWFAKHGS
jgi:hypothetical protein